jgi:tetratricopeptide (TPR) repeat protein
MSMARSNWIALGWIAACVVGLAPLTVSEAGLKYDPPGDEASKPEAPTATIKKRFTGQWHEGNWPDPISVFKFEMRLTITGSKVDGEIEWTFEGSSPPSAAQQRVGTKAVQHVTGTCSYHDSWQELVVTGAPARDAVFPRAAEYSIRLSSEDARVHCSPLRDGEHLYHSGPSSIRDETWEVKLAPAKPRNVETLSELEMARLRLLPIENLMSRALYNIGSFKDWSAVHDYTACLDRPEPAPSEAYLNLALAYLAFGRVDAAIAALEKGRQALPGDETFDEYIQHARNVKSSLSTALEALRRDGIEVTESDERVYAFALRKAPAGDPFLIMNIADAWVGAFPESASALTCVADMNLALAERGGGGNIPGPRAFVASYRGQGALTKLQSVVAASTYPTIRLMQHTLLTQRPGQAFPLGLDRVTSRVEEYGFTGQQRAYLCYGRAVFRLQEDAWGSPAADYVIAWLERAVKHDPDAKPYSTLLENVKSNKDEIDRVKTAAGAREKARSAALAREMFGPANQNDSKKLFHQIVQLVWDEGIKEAERNNDPITAAALKSFGCISCWGRGQQWYSGQPCDGCDGDGEPDPIDW